MLLNEKPAAMTMTMTIQIIPKIVSVVFNLYAVLQNEGTLVLPEAAKSHELVLLIENSQESCGEIRGLSYARF